MKTNLILLFIAVALTGCKKPEPTPTPVPIAPPAATVPATSELPPGHPPLGGAGELPPGHPPLDMSQQTLPPGAQTDAANPQWVVPASWVESKAGMMRRANFSVKGSDGQAAEIIVSAFPGDVGGKLANINRWRGQIGLGPVTEEQAGKLGCSFELNGATVAVVDFTSDKPAAGKTHPQRVIVATIPHDGNSWFFRLTGDAPFVAAQEAAFLEFIKSVKFSSLN